MLGLFASVSYGVKWQHSHTMMTAFCAHGKATEGHSGKCDVSYWFICITLCLHNNTKERWKCESRALFNEWGVRREQLKTITNYISKKNYLNGSWHEQMLGLHHRVLFVWPVLIFLVSSFSGGWWNLPVNVFLFLSSTTLRYFSLNYSTLK